MSTQTTIDYLRTFYAKTSGDIVSLEEMYSAYNRNLAEVSKNRMWLGNKLTHLRRKGFIDPIYKDRALVAVKLTDGGKKVLGRDNPSKASTEASEPNNDYSQVSLEDVMRVLAKLRHDNPEFKIDFSITTK